MASMAAALTGSGTSKSGRPIERLIGSFIDLDMSNALRIPEASIYFILSAIQALFTFLVSCQLLVVSCQRALHGAQVFHWPLETGCLL